MKIGLGLGLTRFAGSGGASDPYASFTAAYDFGNASGYTLNGSNIATAVNLAPGGSGYDLAQATDSLRPVLTSGQAVFDDSNDYLENTSSLPTLIQSNSFHANFTFTIDSLASDGTLFACSQATTNARFWMQFLTNGALRISCRNLAGTTFTTKDVRADGTSLGFSTATEYSLGLEFTGGTLSVWVDGIKVYDAVAFDMSSQDATFTRADVGVLRINASSFSAFGGKIRAFNFKGI